MNDRDPHCDPTADRGALGVILAVMVTLTLAGAALIVDGGRAMAARRHAANTAEAAARAAVSRHTPGTDVNTHVATDAALAYTRAAGIPDSDVRVAVSRPVGAPAEVTVTITERRTSVFLVLASVDELTVQSSGSATSLWAS